LIELGVARLHKIAPNTYVEKTAINNLVVAVFRSPPSESKSCGLTTSLQPVAFML
jgi:hypothetical protein